MHNDRKQKAGPGYDKAQRESWALEKKLVQLTFLETHFLAIFHKKNTEDLYAWQLCTTKALQRYFEPPQDCILHKVYLNEFLCISKIKLHNLRNLVQIMCHEWFTMWVFRLWMLIGPVWISVLMDSPYFVLGGCLLHVYIPVSPHQEDNYTNAEPGAWDANTSATNPISFLQPLTRHTLSTT